MDTFVQYLGKNRIVLENKNSLECYDKWPSPTVIFVDGPYGINGFPGDPKDTRLLPEVYAPHIAEWSKYAKANNTTNRMILQVATLGSIFFMILYVKKQFSNVFTRSFFAPIGLLSLSK